MEYREINYKGHAIMQGVGLDGWTVEMFGDEIFFETVDEAKKFIDEEF